MTCIRKAWWLGLGIMLALAGQGWGQDPKPAPVKPGCPRGYAR